MPDPAAELCIWCGQPKAAHGEPGASDMAKRWKKPTWQLCPGGVTSQFFTTRYGVGAPIYADPAVALCRELFRITPNVFDYERYAGVVLPIIRPYFAEQQRQQSSQPDYRFERLKAFVRDHTSGQCRLFSQPTCDCLLCVIDDLRQEQQRIEQLESELKAERACAVGRAYDALPDDMTIVKTSKLKELEAALAQYADKEHWASCYYDEQKAKNDYDQWQGNGDNGYDIARRALKGEAEGTANDLR